MNDIKLELLLFSLIIIIIYDLLLLEWRKHLFDWLVVVRAWTVLCMKVFVVYICESWQDISGGWPWLARNSLYLLFIVSGH